MIDFHAHVDLYRSPLRVAERTNRENLFTLAVTTSPRAWKATSQMFRRFQNIHVALGMHPEIVDEKYPELGMLLDGIEKEKFVGEVGLDGSLGAGALFKRQLFVFESVIRRCEECGSRVLSIHSRNAVKDVLTILRKYPKCGVKILHWFSGSIEELDEALNLGCMFSVNRLMTMTRRWRIMAEHIPLDRLLLETDGPFAMFAGRAIYPWEAGETLPALSAQYGIDSRSMERRLRTNLKIILGAI